MFQLNKQLPFVAGKIVESFPTSVDKAVGERATAALLQKCAVDEQKSALLKAFYQEAGLGNATAFYVLKDPGYSAYGLPGGTIAISDGCFQYIKTSAQLAGLLVHEELHVSRRLGLIALTDTLLPKLCRNWLTGGNAEPLVVDNATQLLAMPGKLATEIFLDEAAIELLQSKQIDLNGYAEQIIVAGRDSIQKGALMPYAVMHHADSSRLVFFKVRSSTTTNIYSDHNRLDSLFQELKK